MKQINLILVSLATLLMTSFVYAWGPKNIILDNQTSGAVWPAFITFHIEHRISESKPFDLKPPMLAAFSQSNGNQMTLLTSMSPGIALVPTLASTVGRNDAYTLSHMPDENTAFDIAFLTPLQADPNQSGQGDSCIFGFAYSGFHSKLPGFEDYFVIRLGSHCSYSIADQTVTLTIK